MSVEVAAPISDLPPPQEADELTLENGLHAEEDEVVACCGERRESAPVVAAANFSTTNLLTGLYALSIQVLSSYNYKRQKY